MNDPFEDAVRRHRAKAGMPEQGHVRFHFVPDLRPVPSYNEAGDTIHVVTTLEARP